MTYLCTDCRHPNEGISPSAFTNQLRLLVGARRRGPKCSSYRTNGMDDAIMCGCEHPMHADNVVASIYEAKLAQVDD